MDEKKKTLAKKVSDTMACSAYAEAGEPCPIDNEKNRLNRVQQPKHQQDQKKPRWSQCRTPWHAAPMLRQESHAPLTTKKKQLGRTQKNSRRQAVFSQACCNKDLCI
jgi:hypothetical protein